MDRPPPHNPSWRHLALAFAASWLLASVWGSLAQTQFNLAALTALAVEVPMALRLLISLQDLASFGGIYAAAAGVGLVVAIRVVDAVAPMPVFIYATRSTAGLLTMALGSALAGALFARWSGRRELGADRLLEARS